MFPGQGAQHLNMGRDLYDTELVFRRHLDACADRLRLRLGFDLREVLYPAPQVQTAAAGRLQETLVTQAALFAVEYALAQLWMSWGITPAALVGHSVGEYVAACLSGALSLDDALELVTVRGRLMQAAPDGAMVAVPLAEDRVRELTARVGQAVGDELSLAAVNGSSQCVVAGTRKAIDALEDRLRDEAVTYQRLLTGGAFHSSLMAGVVEPLTEAARKVRIETPGIPYVSNVTGGWMTENELREAGYWGRHARETVRFGAAVDTLLTWGAGIFLEVGPGQVLSALVRERVRSRAGAEQSPAAVQTISSLASAREAASDGECLVRALGRLWLAGAAPDWRACHAPERRLRVELPTYPFERKRYWADPFDAVTSAATPAPALSSARKAPLDDWFAIPSWTRSQPPVLREAEEQSWLVFLDGSEPAVQLTERLEQRGHQIVRVRPGDGFRRLAEGSYEIDVVSRADYDALIADLSGSDRLPDAVLHLWNLSGRPVTDAQRAEPAFAAASQQRGFDSLLFLAQAWGDRAANAPLRIAVVTDPVHDVTADDICPEQATMLGAVRVLPQEYGNVVCRLVDVVAGPRLSARSLEQVLAEIESDAVDPIVAYRGIDRWTQSVEPVRLDATAGPPRLLRDGGVYLITGGYGAIGFEIARYLASAVQPKLILVGRSGLPARELWQKHVALHGRDDEVSRRIRAVQSLEESGADVFAARADVASEPQMRTVVAAARERYGRIDGVFHAAGIAGGGVMQLRKPDAVAAVMRPKVGGTRVLERVLADDRPDFMLLCSSLNAITGGAGQADYAGANAFLDAFARYQTTHTDTFTVSVNWDTWRDAGMAAAARLPGDLARAHGDALERGMTSSEGIEALARCLSGTVPQVLVSTVGWHRPVVEATAVVEGAETTAEPNSLPLNPRPNLASAYVAPQDEVQQRICDVWRDALGVVQVGIDDSFFDLGGHSLLAVQVVAKLNADYGTAIPVAKLYEGLTAAFFADLVRAARPAADGDGGDADQRQERRKQQKRHQEKRRVARTGQGRLVQ
jgi:acyl transferase domain-containing protein